MTYPKRSLIWKAIESMSKQLMESISWVEKAPNQRELFCLDFVSSYLDGIPVVDGSFEWVSRCEDNECAVNSILNVYNNYLPNSNYQTTLEQISDTVDQNESKSVKNLFQWVWKIKAFLSKWKERFTKKLMNYDQIMVYKRHLKMLQSMSSRMMVEELVFSEQELKAFKLEYEVEFRKLNSLLLKQVPGDEHRKT